MAKCKGPAKVAAKKEEKSTAKKDHSTISVRRSSGKKEKFDIDRMAQTTGRSGVPFLIARDIAKNTSNKVSKEAEEGRLKEDTVTAGQMRSMVVDELQNRNQQSIASSYSGEVPENTQKDWTLQPHESPIGNADTNQHEAYRPNMDNVMHDQSKRHQSST